MNSKSSQQICVETLFELGFEGNDSFFVRGDCYVSIMGDKIRLGYNFPGIDKEYIGPPLPSAAELKKFIKENT